MGIYSFFSTKSPALYTGIAAGNINQFGKKQ
jgi:hypothetical protein